MGKPIVRKKVVSRSVAVQNTKSRTILFKLSEEQRLTLVRIVGYINAIQQGVSSTEPYTAYITYDRDDTNAIDINPAADFEDDDRLAETVLWGNNDRTAAGASTSGNYDSTRNFVDIRSKRKLRKDDSIVLNHRSSTGNDEVYIRYFLTLFFKPTD